MYTHFIFSYTGHQWALIALIGPLYDKLYTLWPLRPLKVPYTPFNLLCPPMGPPIDCPYILEFEAKTASNSTKSGLKAYKFPLGSIQVRMRPYKAQLAYFAHIIRMILFSPYGHSLFLIVPLRHIWASKSKTISNPNSSAFILPVKC